MSRKPKVSALRGLDRALPTVTRVGSPGEKIRIGLRHAGRQRIQLVERICILRQHVGSWRASQKGLVESVAAIRNQERLYPITRDNPVAPRPGAVGARFVGGPPRRQHHQGQSRGHGTLCQSHRQIPLTAFTPSLT